MTATPSPNSSRSRSSSRCSCSSPRAAVRASNSSSTATAGPRPSFASKSRSSAYSHRAAAARSDALYTMLSPVTNTAATVGQATDSEGGSARACRVRPGGVTDQLDAVAVPVESHVGVQAVDTAGVGQRHRVAGGLRGVDAVEPVGVGHALRDELPEMEQHRPGGGIDGVGVGLDDHRRQLGALVVVAGQRLRVPGLLAARIAGQLGDHFRDGGRGEVDRARVGRRGVAAGRRGGARTGWAGAVIDAVAVVVACGVFATVESPEPQPVNVTASNRRGRAGQWLGTAG